MTDPMHDHGEPGDIPDLTVDDILSAPQQDPPRVESYLCGVVTIPLNHRAEPRAFEFASAFAAFVNAVTVWDPAHDNEFDQVHASCVEALDIFLNVPNNALVLLEIMHYLMMGYDQAARKDAEEGMTSEEVWRKLSQANASLSLSYRMFMNHILDVSGSAWVHPIKGLELP